MSSTARYRFEFRLLDWCEGFSRSLAGNRAAFFLGLRPDGTVRRVYLSRPGEPFEGERKAAAIEAHPSWLLYTPYEAPGTGYLEWMELGRDPVERWLKSKLEPSDLLDVRSTAAPIPWPATWRVIVS